MICVSVEYQGGFKPTFKEATQTMVVMGIFLCKGKFLWQNWEANPVPHDQ
jgi:hypothetical protein